MTRFWSLKAVRPLHRPRLLIRTLNFHSIQSSQEEVSVIEQAYHKVRPYRAVSFASNRKLIREMAMPRLNSTLSVRIEELNAHISTLYVENLRLRASEIALASQLKREREKCQRIMAEAESAVS